MASIENKVNRVEHNRTIVNINMEIEVQSKLAQLKKDKARSKSTFTRLRHRLLLLVEEQDLPSRSEVREACQKLDNIMEIAMEIMTDLSDLYTKLVDSENNKGVIIEMEKMENEFSAAQESAREYLNSRKDELSSIASETVDIDLLQEMRISDNKEKSPREQKTRATGMMYNDMNEVRFNDITPNHNRSDYMSQRYYTPARESYNDHNTCHLANENVINKHMKAHAHHWPDSGWGIGTGNVGMATDSPRQNIFNDVYTQRNSTPFGKTNNVPPPSIGQDLWKQLKRVQIPVFAGDKRCYQSWKAAFVGCIDNAPATAEYKLLQLRQYLAGEALKVIENLGHSAIAYEAAKERLERKYGGKRRQIALYLEDLEMFRKIRPGNAHDIEQFADLLDIAIINLKEAGQHQELGDGSLYTKLQRKLPESMLARYHRWVFENSKIESVSTLRVWIIQESEFQTIASETVHGLTGTPGNTEMKRPYFKPQSHGTFFGGMKESRNLQNVNRKCNMCGMQHCIWMCRKFLDMHVKEKWNFAKFHKLCYRCLGEGHRGNACLRTRPCGLNGCTEVHHRLLHNYGTRYEDGERQISKTHVGAHNTNSKHIDIDRQQYENVSAYKDRVASAMEGKQQKPQTTMMTQAYVKADLIGLRTVPVILRNGTRSLKVNALLDDASTKTYINADVAAELGLHGKTERVTVNVLNGQVETFDTTPVHVMLESVCGKESMNVSAYTANRVTGNMRVVDWNKYARKWRHLERINFPRIASRPIVDILIGMDCADLHFALQEIRGKPGDPIARLTPLGWTCIGCPDPSGKNILQTNFACTYFVKDQSEIEELNVNLRKFWEVEEVSLAEASPIVRIEEKIAMKKIEESIYYENNMYEVGIPWKENKPILPDNYGMALRRLQNTERKLQKSRDIELSYKQCIEKYIEKGYVTKVPENKVKLTKWYLPHFPVLRPDKETTKTRIVFDASAECENISLNSVIHQGPKLQRELFDVILRFRKHPIAVVCDIAEMYLRIGIAKEDRLYHRFLWRGMNTKRPPDVYEFNRVVFGVNSSPFQAQYVSQQHARKHEDEFPMAAETVLKSTYMDDSLDSVIDTERGIELYKQLSQLWSKAGMHARKWMSNSARVLKEIPSEDRTSEVDLDNGQLSCAKTLGVWWLADKDVFTYREHAPDSKMIYTKRNFLKKIATLFDPIGLLAPYTIRAKMLLQDMWASGVEWDEELSQTLIESASKWFSELIDLTQIQIPRCLSDTKKIVNTTTLHTFVDASEKAYGAVVYTRHTYLDESVSSRIVAAKTRVAPSISTSIPRLELMGAIVGVRLTVSIAKTLEIPINQCKFWSDSLNVLWWIRGRSREFKPFVANRVGEIQTYTNPDQWRYVPTSINPADILSRGMKAADLAKVDAWWIGPDFLRQSENVWPENKIVNGNKGCAELKKPMPTQKHSLKGASSQCTEDYSSSTDANRLSFIAIEENTEMFQLKPERYSSWLKLRRIQSWINRFVNNCRLPTEDRVTGELLSEEIKNAEIQIIRQTQRVEFSEEWKALNRGKQLQANSKLLGLNPKIDEDGLMRSDGRLKYAEFLSYDVRYPVILPRRSWVTKLVVKEFHEQGRHASGTNQTLAALSARYWIVSGREVIREWEKTCAECRRRKAKPCKQIMAPLPYIRLKTSLRAFVRTSVDFGGPFITVQGRGKRRQKRYLCLFTCLATRAVHLEIAFGLDTDSFLNALYRMVSRRGLPDEMLSDNGTNFKSADKELKSLVSQLSDEHIRESLANKGIRWHFNPPLAPHFGGAHETMIKAAKKAIYAILGNADVTDEELMTAIIGAEGLINSRPLTYQSADPNDDTPLTPNHFLHGQIGGQFAPQSVDETGFSPRKRWRRIQELVRHFWHRWLREWLPGLNARKKWFQSSRDIRVGEVVLVISPDTSRGSWPLGRVTEVFPGKDGRVRVAKVQIGRNTFLRPVTKLCPLECELPGAEPTDTTDTNSI